MVDFWLLLLLLLQLLLRWLRPLSLFAAYGSSIAMPGFVLYSTKKQVQALCHHLDATSDEANPAKTSFQETIYHRQLVFSRVGWYLGWKQRWLRVRADDTTHVPTTSTDLHCRRGTMYTLLTPFWRRRHVVLLALLLLVLISVIYTAQSDRRTFRVLSSLGIQHSWTEPPSFLPPQKHGCYASNLSVSLTRFPSDNLFKDIQIVMKTGIGEKSKTRTFLETYGSVIDNILIFSDAEYEVGRYKTFDILAELPESYASNNSDWQAYIEQHEALNAGAEVDKWHGGWKLDRFKFLPMVEQAFEMRPDAEWYVFIEADMYYFWDTLFRMLQPLDPDEPHYFGSPTPGAHDRWFAYGGGGTILSHRLVKDLLKDGKQKMSRIPKYEFWAKDDCCGDAVLAYVIHEELGIRLESMYPSMSGEDMHWLKTTKEKWCTPLLDETALALGEMPAIHGGPDHVNWNNGAEAEPPEESQAHKSPKFCQIACVNDSTCLQWRYVNGWCKLADFVMAGSGENNQLRESTSGWNIEALERLGYCVGGDPSIYCREAQWLIPKVT
ncbi:hypothetical protein AC579_236 [Pseudocercospora musae]|uniref:N-acetylgalactosaminide beta-1,3-galactosyltransferase n=1 Tax=Pseudocercospora musae TaxID=113226 RepID=A0A139I468_9PEZI|nr:hypothetical protein AC579_236 [Pseudocercospora musae]